MLRKYLSQIVILSIALLALAYNAYSAPIQTINLTDTIQTWYQKDNSNFASLNQYKLDVASSTDDLQEGIVNLYYTDARVADYINGSSTIPNLACGNGEIVKYNTTSNKWQCGVDLSGSGVWALAGDSLSIYPVDTTDVVIIGGSATTTTGNILEVFGNTKLGGNLAITGTITSGIWNGSVIQDAYIADDITASNYLALTAWYATTTDALTEGVNNLYWTQSRFDTAFANKTTDNLSEGLINLYWTNTRFDQRLSATTSLPNLLTTGYVNQDVRIGSSPTFNTPTISGLVWDGVTLATSSDILALWNTDYLAEGTTNKYYSSTLFDTDFANKTTDDLSEGTINKYYHTSLFASDLAATTTDALTEGVNNLYWTQARFDTAFAGKTTDSLAEGTTNLYWTNARFDQRLSATTSLPNLTTLTGLTTIGTITTGVWNGTPIDISDYTNLAVGTGLSLVGDTISVLDNYVLNTGDIINGALTITATTTIQGELIIPLDQSLYTAGQITIDQTEGQLVYYSGQENVLSSVFTKGFNIESPAVGDETAFWLTPYDITLQELSCQSQGVGVNDYTTIDLITYNSTMTATTSVLTTTVNCGQSLTSTTGFSSASILSGTWIGFSIRNASGTAEWLPTQIKYRINRK